MIFCIIWRCVLAINKSGVRLSVSGLIAMWIKCLADTIGCKVIKKRDRAYVEDRSIAV